jgi:hypothetical protein
VPELTRPISVLDLHPGSASHSAGIEFTACIAVATLAQRAVPAAMN